MFVTERVQSAPGLEMKKQSMPSILLGAGDGSEGKYLLFSGFHVRQLQETGISADTRSSRHISTHIHV